jgi:dephospho-CoA kinase|tara:strand:+ start:2915 stop:3478 length:564 start_codon:yes stop_codon:yes gene_type:complete
MIKIGITGSLSSGKSSAAKIMCKKKYPLFNADKTVSELYKKKTIIDKIKKKFGFKSNNLKKELRKILVNNKNNLKKLEYIIHPLVRKEMKYFYKKNKSRKIVISEIPLLIESKLQNFFDVTIFIKASKSNRLKRFLKKGGNKKIFLYLEKCQLRQSKKEKFCDYIVVNNKPFSILKKNINNIIEKYE